jgi:uncharacterized protein with HEPN domain
MPAIEWERMVYFENGKPIHRVREYDLDDVWMVKTTQVTAKNKVCLKMQSKSLV